MVHLILLQDLTAQGSIDHLPKWTDKGIDFITSFGPVFIGAIFVWILGAWLIKILVKALGRMLDKSKIDDSLKPFFKSMTSVMLKILLLISVFGMLGVEMTSFIALLGAAGLAVGMALSGTLQNFAGGVMILIFKPYKIGDFIEAQGYTGVVKEVQIFNTILTTPDNKTIIIPNGGLSTTRTYQLSVLLVLIQVKR